MDMKIWMEWYETILDDFAFSRTADEKTADVLNEILKNKNTIKIKDLNRDKDSAIVFGAGPSLDKHIKLLKDKIADYVLISSDGATTALLENDIIPDIIITDLDGRMEDIIESYENGSKLIIHAHGDNEEAIAKYVPKFNNIMGTTQSLPFENLHNFGGFTDGDRAVFTAVEIGIKEIILAGMDFGDKVTNYSRPSIGDKIAPADDIKKKKLLYAKVLIEWIRENEDVKIFNLIDE